MTKLKLIALFAVVSVMALAPSSADAQGRGRSGGVRRAVPRITAPRIGRPRIVAVAPYRYYPPRYSLGFDYGYPGYRYPGAYGFAPSWYGPGYPVYGYRAPGYFVQAPGRAYGGVRIDLPQRNAEVYVDGYLVGMVDSFDGVFQQVNLESGPHRIEIRAPGYESIAFDVRVEPGRTITYRADMQPVRP